MSAEQAGELPGDPLTDVGFQAVLDAMQDEVAIGAAVRDRAGHITDFVVRYVNQGHVDGAGRTAYELIGRTLTELYPESLSNGLIAMFARVVETGEPFIQDRMLYQEVLDDDTTIDGYWSMSVARFGDGYVASTRQVTDLVREEERLRRAELDVQQSHMAVDFLQRAALPTRIPVVEGAEIAARYRPAATDQPVGGDWYDIFEFGHGRIGLVIADVAGHGPEAAAFMVQVRNVVRAYAFEYIHPDAVLEASNRMVCRLQEANPFATCCYAIVEPRSGRVSWASAGHVRPLVLGVQDRYLANEVGPPLGVDPGARFRAASEHLEPGDRLVMFTDGLVEVRGRSLHDSLDQLLEPGPPAERDDVEATVDRLVADAADASDDIAIVCLRRTP